MYAERKSLCSVQECCFCCCLFGFNVALNNFSVISQLCLAATGSSMLTEVSCPRHLTWYHTQSHYPDTGLTSPSSTVLSLIAKPGAASTIFNEWYVAAQDRTRDLPFPEADTLSTELSVVQKSMEKIQNHCYIYMTDAAMQKRLKGMFSSAVSSNMTYSHSWSFMSKSIHTLPFTRMQNRNQYLNSIKGFSGLAVGV